MPAVATPSPLGLPVGPIAPFPVLSNQERAVSLMSRLADDLEHVVGREEGPGEDNDLERGTPERWGYHFMRVTTQDIDAAGGIFPAMWELATFNVEDLEERTHIYVKADRERECFVMSFTRLSARDGETVVECDMHVTVPREGLFAFLLAMVERGVTIADSSCQAVTF